MSKSRVKLGRRGEVLAGAGLEEKGYTIVARNWRCPEGEADLIACRAGEWYFVEVRTRRGTAHGSPEESLVPRKRGRMEAVARRYLSEQAPAGDPSWHLSLFAVALDAAGRLVRLTFYPDLEGEVAETLPLPEISEEL